MLWGTVPATNRTARTSFTNYGSEGQQLTSLCRTSVCGNQGKLPMYHQSVASDPYSSDPGLPNPRPTLSTSHSRHSTILHSTIRQFASLLQPTQHSEIMGFGVAQQLQSKPSAAIAFLAKQMMSHLYKGCVALGRATHLRQAQLCTASIYQCLLNPFMSDHHYCCQDHLPVLLTLSSLH